MILRCAFLLATVALVNAPLATALDRAGVSYKVFQFPPNAIPRVDGKVDDWAIVPEAYMIGTQQLLDDSGKHGDKTDPKSLDVRVKVGWVKGMNRLYFLYEAYDDYWDFSLPGLHNDTFEVVVDGDLSGGPLIESLHPNKELAGREAFHGFHGVHAQNYHIFTPSRDKDWTMAWGCQPWIKNLPYANAAQDFKFQPGASGKYVLEFWITLFDYASCEGPARSVESQLRENKTIGLSWAIIDYDDVKSRENNGFWNLSRQHTMFGKASELVAFKLMPLEPSLRPAIQAGWSFKVLDLERRAVAFQDESEGEVKMWKWDFGDGTTSAEQHPVHTYSRTGNFVVVLTVEGPAGKSARSKVWDVTFR